MTGPLCAAAHPHYPDTLCLEVSGHYRTGGRPHAGLLIINGREAGAVAWAEGEPRAGRPALEDLDAAPESVCCYVCGGGPVTYHNHHGLPFCRLCADCRCGQNPCTRTGVDDPAVSEAAEVERLRRMVRQLMTVNRRHADQLTDAHRVTIGDLRRAEGQVRILEAALARVEVLAARVEAGDPVQGNVDNLAAAIRGAARLVQPKEKP